MFLPITMEDMKERGWQQPDFVLVTGDAYVDHPSFGTAIISRFLEAHGFKVAILSQPKWQDAEDFKRFGRPRLGFLINSGNVDSMVNHYSVTKHKRNRDAYSPGGKTGKRPDRAVIVYSNRAREAYRDAPIIIGGLEASLRRLGHYDYWSDKVRRSILLDAKADLLIYGMGERAVLEIAEALDAGILIQDINWIRGTCWKKRGGHASKAEPDREETKNSREYSLLPDFYPEQDVVLPPFTAIAASKEKYCDSFRLQYRSNDAVTGKRLIEPYENGICVIQNPPQPPLERQELDQLYALPYMRSYHPIYREEGGVPAIEEIRFSITANRGCFGGCAFCAITYHQGREVRSRSKESIVAEAGEMVQSRDFKGYIHDIGGPTANFRRPSCKKQLKDGMCHHKDCLYPTPCRQLDVDHKEYLDVLEAVRSLDGIKKVFIRSGIRYDYLMADKDDTFIHALCSHHVSGILKVAPEHVSDQVLKRMRKPSSKVFDSFSTRYKAINKKLGKKQYMVPYFISSHPGSTLEDAIQLALYMKKTGFIPDQVQDFYPTPGTLATCMYHTEMDPFTKEKIYVAKTPKEKNMQRALMHFHKKENRRLVREALEKAGRKDLMGVLVK